ncbi:MAG: SH3 domain-containing protein [Nitrosomonadales bacterium]|nr:SH3 domain-containing protein [Nitrosomonadales bacterium]
MNNIIRHHWSVVLLGMLFSIGFVAQLHAVEPGKTIVAADLKQHPFSDAPTITNLASDTELEVIKRQGGWMQVKSGANEGWLKMTAVKLGTGAATQGKGGGGLGTLFNLATTGRSGSSGVTVTTGIRGLGQEELKNAQPDHAAVQKMETFVGARNEAASFASGGKLQAQKVEYLGAATAAANVNSSNQLGGRR